jgi:hypothetical protein
MTEQEVYKKIKPLIEGYTEGLSWDFKKTLNDTAEIIKDVLAFSNSNYEGDSYIIVGVSEPESKQDGHKLKLSSADRKRLETSDNYLYLPGKWRISGLSTKEIGGMKEFSKKLTERLGAYMLISQPQCEFIPVQIKSKRWLFVIIVKNVPGVFISKKDINSDYRIDKVVVKQGVLYVRVADTTIGAEPNVASAMEHIRVWKRYIDWLSNHDSESISKE